MCINVHIFASLVICFVSHFVSFVWVNDTVLLSSIKSALPFCLFLQPLLKQYPSRTKQSSFRIHAGVFIYYFPLSLLLFVLCNFQHSDIHLRPNLRSKCKDLCARADASLFCACQNYCCSSSSQNPFTQSGGCTNFAFFRNL